MVERVGRFVRISDPALQLKAKRTSYVKREPASINVVCAVSPEGSVKLKGCCCVDQIDSAFFHGKKIVDDIERGIGAELDVTAHICHRLCRNGGEASTVLENDVIVVFGIELDLD